MDLVRILDYDKDLEEIRSITARRTTQIDGTLICSVAEIIEDVRERGDEAVLEATEKFDSVELSEIVVSPEEIEAAMEGLSGELRTALGRAAERIEKVSRSLLPPECVWTKEIEPGITVGEKTSPIPSAGLWVPSRKGPLASTMLMLTVPARTAGVGEIVAATPPMEDGSVDPATLAAAKMGGATRVIRGNGVALIGAMSTGTESVPRVGAIYGPGPPAIVAALGYAGIYGIRTGPVLGPSECMIIADDSSDPMEVTADLLNECEHGPDSSCVLVTESDELASQVQAALSSIADNLPEPRRGFVREALPSTGMIVLVKGLEEAASMANEFAPEHLQIALEGERQSRLLGLITNAGEILLGQSTPFSAANYAMGITAVLPTGGSAKAFSGINARDFVKTSTLGGVRRDSLGRVCDIVSALGDAEGFPAHVDACRRKMGDPNAPDENK
ncbi:MAG: histidinol dehydrogenase [Theionarchaea archaeon]|nr:histidinol dehydrogenase [Theionarchaea archaeon]